jgi:glycosyltransferase involved in cell wall biosynthesis
MSPRVAIGAPIYNKARWLPEAVESLLGQTFGDFALVLIDDGSDDGSADIARAFAERDARVHLHVNERRLGMLGNTNRALELPLERFPGAEYCALASDHDLWSPRWLESLVALLDADPGAVLAYPQTRRIDDDGREFERQKAPWRLQTAGIADPRERMRAAFRGMVAGDMIYGLFRADALRRVGGYEPVLVPDRLLLSRLALEGAFVQAPEVLWRRRFRGLADLDRQRRLFWPDGVPLYARAPWWLQHTVMLARDGGARVALDYLELSLRHRLWRRSRRLKGRTIRARNALLAPPVRAALRVPAVRRALTASVVPALARAEETLERLTREPAA